jgi:hypothetical protein
MMAERCRTARGGVLRDDARIGAELLGYFGRLVNRSSGAYERKEKACQDFDADSFDQGKTRLHEALERALGKRLVTPYLIVALDPVPGSQLHSYGLSLPPDAVTIAPASLRAEQPPAPQGIFQRGKRRRG